MGHFGSPQNSFTGTKIIVSAEAYEMVAIFPDKPRTKRRRRRTMAKFGRLDRMNPLAYNTPHGIIMHTKIHKALLERTKKPATN